MKLNKKFLLLPPILLILSTQACLIPLPDWTFDNLDRFLCTNLTGKDWVEDKNGGQCLDPSESEADQPADVPDKDNQPQGSQEPVYADPASCNAYGEVSLGKSDPEKSETSYETKCEYTLEFTNTSGETIWIFLHEHNRFMNGEEEHKWDNYLNLASGESYLIECDYTVRKSDQAVSAHITDKVALIYATEGCINTFKNNDQPKDLIAAQTPIQCGP